MEEAPWGFLERNNLRVDSQLGGHYGVAQQSGAIPV
jgi:hypothetical protein